VYQLSHPLDPGHEPGLVARRDDATFAVERPRPEVVSYGDRGNASNPTLSRQENIRAVKAISPIRSDRVEQRFKLSVANQPCATRLKKSGMTLWFPRSRRG